MKSLYEVFREQYGVATRAQAVAAGWKARRIDHMLHSGAWQRIHPGVYAAADLPMSPERAISAACLAAGQSAAVSHRSAAWLWSLLEEPPEQVDLIVPRKNNQTLTDVHLYRPRRQEDLHVVPHRLLSVTDPHRTIVDLATVLDAEGIDGAVDRGVASRLVTVPGIVAELERRSRKGRPGLELMRDRLKARGMIDVPNPSVLESLTHRFLHRIRVGWLALEVAFFGGRYRVDTQLALRAFLEVDGYTYHSNPEAKAGDEERRRQIRRTGVCLAVLDWHQVRFQPKLAERVVRELLEDAGEAPPRRLRLPPGT